MKAVSVSSDFPMIFFFFFTTIISSVVNSQTDSCSSNLSLSNILFDTASLRCSPVWDSHGFILRYGQNNLNKSIWSFVLSAPDPTSFMAIGFSKTGQMVGSSAVVGWISNGSPYIRRYYLGGTLPNRVELNQGNLTVLSNTATIASQSSRLYMAFQLVIEGGGEPKTQLLYSVGPVGFYPVEPNLRLMAHRSRVATTINYATGTSNSKSSPFLSLRRSHGIFNMLGWGILMMIGAMVARYFRHRDPLWFYLHAGIQSVALLMGISGILCGFLLDNRLHANVSTHKGLGIFIFVLGCLQAMALLARPSKTAKNRKYWNWYHHIVGRTLQIFALANIFYGIKLGGEGTGWTAGYAVVLCILFVTSAILEYRLWASGN